MPRSVNYGSSADGVKRKRGQNEDYLQKVADRELRSAAAKKKKTDVLVDPLLNFVTAVDPVPTLVMVSNPTSFPEPVGSLQVPVGVVRSDSPIASGFVPPPFTSSLAAGAVGGAPILSPNSAVPLDPFVLGVPTGRLPFSQAQSDRLAPQVVRQSQSRQGDASSPPILGGVSQQAFYAQERHSNSRGTRARQEGRGRDSPSQLYEQRGSPSSSRAGRDSSRHAQYQGFDETVYGVNHPASGRFRNSPDLSLRSFCGPSDSSSSSRGHYAVQSAGLSSSAGFRAVDQARRGDSIPASGRAGSAGNPVLLSSYGPLQSSRELERPDPSALPRAEFDVGPSRATGLPPPVMCVPSANQAGVRSVGSVAAFSRAGHVDLSSPGPVTAAGVAVPLPVPVPLVDFASTLDASLRANTQTRFERGEYLGTLEDLRGFIRECGRFLNATQAKAVRAVMADHDAMAAFVGDLVQNEGKLVSPAVALSASDQGGFAFIDLDGVSHATESRNSAAVAGSAKEYNTEMLRWRFWPLNRSPTLLCRPTSPFLFDAPAFRKWVLEQSVLHSADVRHCYLRGIENGDAWTSVLALARLKWFLAPPNLFFALGALNMGRFGRDSLPLLLPGHFYCPPGAVLERGAAARQFQVDVATPSFTGEGMLEAFVVCLAGVLLCPALVSEYREQKIEYLYFLVAQSCSPQVALAQFFRCVTELVSLLYADMRADTEETEPGSGVTVASVFKARVGVPKWFIGRLAGALVVTDSGRQTTARIAAIEYFGAGAVSSPPVVTPVTSPSVSQSSSSASSGPCIYAFLERFRPGLNFKCRVAACAYSHELALGEGSYKEAILSILEKAGASSALGLQKDSIIASLRG